ncbi:hypothetical protein MRBLMR1_001095 [Neorhizobium sp. LMR1-1-1.1]
MKSPWAHYATTGTPLDYTPIDAPIVEKSDIPDRPSRLWGWVYATGALIAGVLLGALI